MYYESDGLWVVPSTVHSAISCALGHQNTITIPCIENTVIPNSKVHGANMGPIWGRQDPGGPHVGPMNFAIWG